MLFNAFFVFDFVRIIDTLTLDLDPLWFDCNKFFFVHLFNVYVMLFEACDAIISGINRNPVEF